MKQNQDWEKLILNLIDQNIDFVIVGGFAATLHGATQVTLDLDICCRLTPNDILKLRTALKDYHPKHRQTPQKLSFLEYPENITGIKNIYIISDIGILDVLGDIIAVGDYDAVKKNAELIQYKGKECYVIGLDDLIKAKESLARHKDLLVAQELKQIKKLSS